MKSTIRNALISASVATLLSLFLGMTAINSLAAEQEVKRVFILNSFNRTYTWTENVLRGIDNTFGSSGIKIETYTFFMDMKRIPPTPQYFSKLKDLIQEGYKGVHFDAVLACDNDAMEFVRKYRDELFPGVPVVFSSINDYDEKMLDGRNDITGTSENTDYAGTIKIALTLKPATKNIVVVVDNTTTGKAHLAAVKKIRNDFPKDLAFTYISFANMTLDQLAQKLSQLDTDSIVLLLQHFVDKNGATYTVQQSTPLLIKSSSVPVFVLTDIRMGMGALGGHVVSGYHQGEAAAQMVVKILNGTDIRTIPVLLDSPNKYMFDYDAMQRFNIAERDLPQGSIIINKPISVLEKYRAYLLAILGVFIILSGIVVCLLLEIRRRKKSEGALRENQKMLRCILDTIPQSVFWKNIEGVYMGCNKVFSKTLGLNSPQEIAGKTDFDLPLAKTDAEGYRADDRHVISTNTPKLHIIEQVRLADGTQLWVDTSKLPLENDHGATYGIIGIYEDITERKKEEEKKEKLEIQLRQSQKMDAIGQLAGGIAHDFNNMLSVINGYSNMALTTLTPSDTHYECLTAIRDAGQHSADLTKQLLAFARKQVTMPKVLDVNGNIAEMLNILRRILGENIETVWRPADNLWQVKVDPSQLGQILMNLLVNSRDAISGAGKVTIETGNTELDEDDCKVNPGLVPGKYVVLSVNDSGCGMDKETIDHIFEPFFTTKESGKGTGLGLATVFGIVRQNNGFINVHSEPGKGTTFKIYLPRHIPENEGTP